jgi:hypothetical protein
MNFTFDNPAARKNAQLIHDLSRDLTLIEQLRAPGIRDIIAAPLLENWRLAHRLEVALVGTVSNHPLLRDGQVVTSTVHYLDDKASYARTLSRWYRLGAPQG